MVGTMSVMASIGDAKITWDSGKQEEVKTARKMFDDLRGKGYRAFRMSEGGTRGEPMNRFNEEVEEIIMVPPLQGG